MPLDEPSFGGEAQISLQAATLTSSGCINPAFAIDDDPATATQFGSPAPGGLLVEWDAPAGQLPDSYTLKRSASSGTETVYLPGLTETHYLDTAVIAGQAYWYVVTAFYGGVESAPSNEGFGIPVLVTRFLRVDWGYDAFLSRVRLAYSGAGAGNAGVDYEASLALRSDHDAPADVGLSYIPGPADGNVHDVVFNPPVLARGIVFYPDALLSGPSSQAVILSQLQVYQDISLNVSQGTSSMPKPTVNQARVGCSGAVITPRASNVATSYPFPQALAAVLQSIQGLDFTTAVKLARETGGDTSHQINGWETDREMKCKISMERHDYQALQNLLGGTLITNPAANGLGETQYHAPNYGDRAPYFSLVALSSNGDPTAQFVLPKCKIDGNLGQNLERDKTTVVEVDFVLFWDFNYTRQDGQLGGIYEQVFTNGSTPGLHS